jgi:hypothetical protein
LHTTGKIHTRTSSRHSYARFARLPRELPQPLVRRRRLRCNRRKAVRSVDIDSFLPEYDTERAGGFEPLRLLIVETAHKVWV